MPYFKFQMQTIKIEENREITPLKENCVSPFPHISHWKSFEVFELQKINKVESKWVKRERQRRERDRKKCWWCCHRYFGLEIGTKQNEWRCSDFIRSTKNGSLFCTQERNHHSIFCCVSYLHRRNSHFYNNNSHCFFRFFCFTSASLFIRLH